MTPIPIGDMPMKLCECGCGKPAPIAKRTRKERGRVKGQPQRFIYGHNRRRPLATRFWEKVDRNGPLPSTEAVAVHPEIKGQRCWLYAGHAGTRHHKSIGVTDGRLAQAHRAAWFLATGRWPERWILHKCDVRNCVRVEHLFEGTVQDNADDMMAKQRDRSVGERNPNVKLTAEQVAAIRSEGAPWARVASRSRKLAASQC